MSLSPDVSVIVPAYHEVENLTELTERLFSTFERCKRSAEMIIVDDDSGDGTAALCKELAQQYPVKLITRTDERGLATAVVCGIRAAYGRIIVVMDADLSHPPESVPDLIDALESGNSDFVIGSRYVEGGQVDAAWSLYRYINSRVATLLASGLTRAHDPMAGFFAIRKSSIIDLAELKPCGFKIALELIVRCRCQQIAEVPIHFGDRKHGTSKLNIREQWLFIRHLLRLYSIRFPGLAQFVRFGLVGFSGMMIDLFLFLLLLEPIGSPVARAIAIWVAMTWNFELNRRFTFHVPTSASLVAEYVRFCSSCIVGASLSWTSSLALMNAFEVFDHHSAAAAVVGTGLAMFVNYTLCRVWVFGRRRIAPKPAVVSAIPGHWHGTPPI